MVSPFESAYGLAPCVVRRQHFLNLRPLPQGQGSLRPASGSALTSSARSCSISSSGGCPAHSSAAIRPCIGTAVREEAPIAGTQVVQARLAVGRPDDAILRAAAVAHRPDVALPAVARQRLLLGLPEGVLRRALEEFGKRGLADVAQPVLGGDEVIALIEVAVVLDDRDIPAGGTEDAQRMVQAVGRPRGFLEDLDDDPPDVLPHPLVEDRAQEVAEGFRRHGALAHAARRGRLRLDQGDEAEVLGLDLLEEAIDVERVPDVLRMDDTEKIDGDLRAAAAGDSPASPAGAWRFWSLVTR